MSRTAGSASGSTARASVIAALPAVGYLDRPEIDAFYIRFVERKQECRSIRLNEEVALNIGAGWSLVGNEVLGAGQVPAVVIEGLTSSAAPLVVREKPAKKYGK
jgi:hypothetical protein